MPAPGAPPPALDEASLCSGVYAWLVWATRTQHWWMYGLLPLIVLLAPLVRDHEERPASGDIYPLF